MEINLEQKSKELKALVSQFETHMFLGDLSSMTSFISMENPTPSLQGLSSPLRQLYYLGALNLTSSLPDNQELRPQYSQEEWDKIKLLLKEIETGYDHFFYPKNEDEIDENWKHRRLVAMPSFLGYFNQGPMNYEEQVIERVQEYFSPFEQEIVHHFGIGVGDFIDIYNYLDSLPNKFLEEKINKKEGQQSWEEFGQSIFEKRLTPDKWNENLPEHFINFFSFMYDKGQMRRFTRNDLETQFNKPKADAFLNVLVCNRTESNFLYYTEQNILQLQPIFLVENDEFQCFETKQIIHAIYHILQEFCTRDKQSSEKFYAVRGNKLESKIVSIFQAYFDNKAQAFKSFYTQNSQDGKEQDILFLVDNLALIIEAKASKRKEPKREPDKAYPLILSNFKDVIQKGYDQAYRVKSKFLKRTPFKIFRDQKLTKLEAEVRAKKYYHVFSALLHE